MEKIDIKTQKEFINVFKRFISVNYFRRFNKINELDFEHQTVTDIEDKFKLARVMDKPYISPEDQLTEPLEKDLE